MFLEVFRQNYTLIHKIFLGNLSISVQQWLKLHVFRFKYFAIYSNCKRAIKKVMILMYILSKKKHYITSVCVICNCQVKVLTFIDFSISLQIYLGH